MGVRGGERDRTRSRTEEQRDHRNDVSDMVRGDRGSSRWRYGAAVLAAMHRTVGAGAGTGGAGRNWARTYARLCRRRTARTGEYTGISRSVGPGVQRNTPRNRCRRQDRRSFRETMHGHTEESAVSTADLREELRGLLEAGHVLALDELRRCRTRPPWRRSQPRGAVIERGTPAEAIVETNRDDFKRVKRGTHGPGFDALALVRHGSRAKLGPWPLDGFSGSFSGRGDALSGPGSRALHRATAEPGLGSCGLRSLSRAPRRPRTGSRGA